MRHYLCGRAHGHARFTTRPRRTGFHWREGPAKRVRERTAMYPRHRGSVVPRDPDSVDVSQGLELCSQPWRTAGCGSPRAHPPRTIPKLRAEAAPCPLRVRLGSRVTQSRLPLFPQQQTFKSPRVKSEKCQEPFPNSELCIFLHTVAFEGVPDFFRTGDPAEGHLDHSQRCLMSAVARIAPRWLAYAVRRK